ncbi:MAG: ABC transporter permease [Opitutaceae bacterium]
MRALRARLHRLCGLFRRDRLEAEMKAEMQAHLDRLTERNLAAGMTPDDARHAALREFGGMAQFAEEARDEQRSLWAEQLVQDLRYAVRSLAKSPAFTLTAVVTLGLGIGVNTALFSVVNMVALRPLPVKDPENLVVLAGRTARGDTRSNFGYTEYLDYRAGNQTLDLLAAGGTFSAITSPIVTFEDDGAAQADPARDGRGSNLVSVRWVSDNYFAVLGGPIQLGRAFRPDETTLGAEPVIVLSHLFWETRFRRDPRVIGRTLMINRQPATVIGVAAPEFSGHEAVPPAFWLPLSDWSRRLTDYAAGGPEAFNLIGRLKRGITEAQAKADLDIIAKRRAADSPGENATVAVQLERGLYFNNLTRNTAGTVFLSIVIFSFGLVLALACTNVANLVLARSVTRRSEIGVRLMLGAGRGRIVRQLLTENLLLCVPGAVLGLALATWTLQLLLPVVVSRLPTDWAMDTRHLAFFRTMPDLSVLSFTAVLTVGATLVTGLLPAWHASGRNLMAAVRNEGHPIAGRLTPSRLRKLLVIGQVAISLTLLSCAGVMTRNLIARTKVETGYDAQAVFAVALTPNHGSTNPNGEFRRALATVRAIPGVVASGVADPAPLRGGRPARLRPSGPAPGGAELQVNSSSVSEGTFEAFGIQFRRGRTFREAELQAASRAVVVSETLARRLWPEKDPLGQTLAVGEKLWNTRERSAPPDAFRMCEVIGVVRDIQMEPLHDNHELIYLPAPLDVWPGAPLYVRPRQVTAKSLAEIVDAAKAGGLNLQFERRHSYWVDFMMLPFYAFAVTSASLGLLALGMASVGLYGLMTFSVHQRVHEIGVRMALGATPGQVVRLFVREGLSLVAVGLALGLVGGGIFALAWSKLTLGFLNAFDPVAYVAVTLLFGVIAVFACWLPARRATKVNPAVALRAE